MGAHTLAAGTEIPLSDFGYTIEKPLRLEADEQLLVGMGVALAAGVAFSSEWGNF